MACSKRDDDHLIWKPQPEGVRIFAPDGNHIDSYLSEQSGQRSVRRGAKAARKTSPHGVQLTITRLILLLMAVFLVLFALKVLLNRPRR